MKVNVLGTEYDLNVISKSEREKYTDLPEHADGYCNYHTKEIVVVKDESDDQGHDKYVNQVIRHEVIHAFLYESGLHDRAGDEMMVDWIAIQSIKMAKLFNDIEIS